jgi:SAM-dependent methyltransferase
MPMGSGDRWPDDYDRGRPGWPSGVVDLLGLPPTATTLDLGAGTGKLTQLLVARFQHVIAVEPSDAMRHLLMARWPTTEAHAGTGQSIPLPDGSVDAAFAAEAFHWFYDDRSLHEIARVLRAGAPLVLLWNLPAGPWEPSVASAEAVLRTRLGGVDVGHDPLDLGGPQRLPAGWPESVVSAGFEPLSQRRLPNPQTLDADGVVAFFASMGWVADIDDEERLPLLAEVRSLLTASEYRRLWTTHRYTTRLEPLQGGGEVVAQ